MSYEILHLGDQLGRSAESTAITAIVATLIALTARSLWPIPARSLWPIPVRSVWPSLATKGVRGVG